MVYFRNPANSADNAKERGKKRIAVWAVVLAAVTALSSCDKADPIPKPPVLTEPPVERIDTVFTSNSQYSTSNSQYFTSNSQYSTSQTQYFTSNSEYFTSQTQYSTSNSEYSTSNSEYFTSKIEFRELVATLNFIRHTYFVKTR
jgi:hypothetical protein